MTSGAGSTTASTELAAELAMRGRLVALDPAGARRASLQVAFDRRIVTEQSILLEGMDTGAVVRVAARLERDTHQLRIGIAMRPDTPHLPSALLPALRFASALDLGGMVELHLADAPEPVHASVEEWASEVTPAYVELVERLARIQELTATAFPMPEVMTVGDVDEILKADRLLAGETLVGHWTRGEISFERVKLDVFGSKPLDVIFRLESDATYTAEVAGHAIPVGMVVQRVRQARITNLEPDKGDEVRVTVEAADDDTIETTLFNPVPFDPFDRDRAERLNVALTSPNGEPKDLTGSTVNAHDEYAGQWVAQVGDEIVASAGSPQEVVAALTRTGRRGAIWRVPASRTEADALMGTSG